MIFLTLKKYLVLQIELIYWSHNKMILLVQIFYFNLWNRNSYNKTNNCFLFRNCQMLFISPEDSESEVISIFLGYVHIFNCSSNESIIRFNTTLSVMWLTKWWAPFFVCLSTFDEQSIKCGLPSIWQTF